MERSDGWTVWERYDGDGKTFAVHVAPNHDSGPHVLDSPCRCGPRLVEEIGSLPMYIHHSFDGREKFEEISKRLM